MCGYSGCYMCVLVGVVCVCFSGCCMCGLVGVVCVFSGCCMCVYVSMGVHVVCGCCVGVLWVSVGSGVTMTLLDQFCATKKGAKSVGSSCYRKCPSGSGSYSVLLDPARARRV